MTVSNPRDLFLTVLSDLLFVERQLAFQALPELLKQVSDPELGHALSEHLEVTKRHAQDLEAVFRSVGAEPSCDHSFAFAGLQEQRSSRASSIVLPRLADLFHATAAAHSEHYEIAAYQTLSALAGSITDDPALGVLQANLADEQHALTALEESIQRLAQAASR